MSDKVSATTVRVIGHVPELICHLRWVLENTAQKRTQESIHACISISQGSRSSFLKFLSTSEIVFPKSSRHVCFTECSSAPICGTQVLCWPSGLRDPTSKSDIYSPRRQPGTSNLLTSQNCTVISKELCGWIFKRKKTIKSHTFYVSLHFYVG